MPPNRLDDPYPGYNFKVIVTGISDGSAVTGAFTEVTGLEAEIKGIEYRNGNEGITMRKIPGWSRIPTSR
jgi:hypothetical protein